MKRIILLLLLVATPVFAQHTYYVSKSAGNDNNTSAAAQSPTTPWAHIPGMPSCALQCAAYTPVAGDRFILKGGDTWVASDMGVKWHWAGTSGAHIYIGVDPTFFTGASWVRPIFDSQNTFPSGNTFGFQFYVDVGSNFVTIDNFEFKGELVNNSSCSSSGSGGGFSTAAPNIELENSYFHGWFHPAGTCGPGNLNPYALSSNIGSTPYPAASNFHNNVIDGSDSPKDIMGGIEHADTVANNVITQVYNGMNGAFRDVHGNNVGPNYLSFTGDHCNLIFFQDTFNGATTALAYNNIIHNTGGCSGGTSLWLLGNCSGECSAYTTYAFGNVMYDTSIGSSGGISTAGHQANGNAGTFYVYGNTVAPGNSGSTECMGDGDTGASGIGTVHYSNNHCVGPGPICLATAVTCINDGTNLSQTLQAANAAGYNDTQTFPFSPTSSSSPTVGVGANRTSGGSLNCTTVAAFCSDSAYATYNTTNHTVVMRLVNARPSSGAWDIGAYEFAAAGPPTLVAPVFTPIPGGYVTTTGPIQTTGLPNFPWNTPSPFNPTVTIMDNSPGATLCVTVDNSPPTTPTPPDGTCTGTATRFPPGMYPTTTGFTQYQVPQSSIAAITVNSTTTIKALATQIGFTNSPVVTGVYTIDSSCGTPVGTPYTETAGTATWASGTTTVTLNRTTNILVGEYIEVSGALPGVFNGVFQISAVNGNNISYLQAANPGNLTTGGIFYGVTGTDGTNGIGVTDGLDYVKFYWTTDLPTDARVEVGGDNRHTPFIYVPALGLPPQDAGGTTSHLITVTGLNPTPLVSGSDISFGLVSYTIGTGGLVCGSASRFKYAPAYTGGGGGQITPPNPVVNAPPAAYKIYVHGNQHVTAGYSAYIAVDMINLTRTAPAGQSLTLALTGEPPTGTSFNWMGASSRAANTGNGNCTNTAIDTSTNGDTLTKTVVCNDTNKMGTFGPREFQLVTTTSTPPGNYTLVVTMSGNSTTNTVNWPLTVDPQCPGASCAPFGITLTKQAPTTYPTIPNQAAYLAAISAFGGQALICAQDRHTDAPSQFIRPNDNSELTFVGFSTTFGSWFYDGVNAWFGADSLLGNWGGALAGSTQLNWSQCREDVSEIFRDKTVLGVVVPTILEASQGYYQDYLIGGGLEGKPLDLQEVTQMATQPQSPFISTGGSYLSLTNPREVAYTASGFIHGVALGLDLPISITSIPANTTAGNITITSNLFATTPPGYYGQSRNQEVLIANGPAFYNGLHNVLNFTSTTFTYAAGANGPGCATSCGTVSFNPTTATGQTSSTGTAATPMAAFTDYTKDHIIAQMEEGCIQQDFSLSWEEFMLGLSARSLVEYYNIINPDPRIPPIIKACADFLYSQFQVANVGNWRYVTEQSFGSGNTTAGLLPGQGGTCTNEEYSMVVPIWSWLYQYSGLPLYQQEGDYIFGLNATFTTGNGGTTNTSGQAQLPGGCYASANQFDFFGIGSGSIGKVYSQHYFWGTQNYVSVRNPIFNIFPASVGVYNQPQNTTSTPQIVTLTNPSTPTSLGLTLGTRSITGIDASHFAISAPSTTCGATLSVGSSCTIGVTFSPATSLTQITSYGGLATAPNTFLNIPVGASTYKVPLYGVGVIGITAGPVLNPQPGTITAQPVSFTSSTPNALICLSTQANGPYPAGNGNVITTGGGTCSDGTASVTNGGSVSVSSNTTFYRTIATAPGFADSITLPQAQFTVTAATATATLSPNLNFGNQNVNTTSSGLATTYTNTGTVPVTVTQAQLFGTSFSLTNLGTCTGTTFTLQPAPATPNTCTFIVTFSPQVTGPLSGSFQVTDNAAGSPRSITLSGTGTAPIITMSSPQANPAIYNFGTVPIGVPSSSPSATCVASPSSCLELSNTGTGPLNVSLTITGANIPQFSPITSNNCGTILAAGSSCTIVDTFTPTAAASYTAFLTETDSVQSITGSITLNGVGITPPVNIIAPNPVMTISGLENHEKVSSDSCSTAHLIICVPSPSEYIHVDGLPH